MKIKIKGRSRTSTKLSLISVRLPTSHALKVPVTLFCSFRCDDGGDDDVDDGGDGDGDDGGDDDVDVDGD